MTRRLGAGALLMTLLLAIAPTVFAESSASALERSVRERYWRGGSLEGRTMLRAHLGVSSPTGDFGDILETGWGLGASLGYGVSRNVVISWGVAYHRFSEEFFDGHASVTPVTVSADYGFSTSGKVTPWISGGLGLYHVNFEETFFEPGVGFVTASDSENDLGMNFGFGIATPISPRTAFGAGLKFHHVFGDEFIDADFVAIQAGFGFTL